MKHPSLLRPPSNLVGGAWIPIPGSGLTSRNPARPAGVIWQGSPPVAHVDGALRAARAAFPSWSAWPMERRAGVLRRVQRLAEQRLDALAILLRDEVGKPDWDARAEAGLLAPKIDITLDTSPHGALRRVTGYDLDLGGTKSGACWFRPHGVMGVLGPFNFPMHLPNGHVVPALLMGNTVVFKPSDKTPACGQALAELFHDALVAEDAPPGVFNLVQGAADVAAALASHDGPDGLLMTGSWPVGRRIMEANLDRPGRILALEMGGNSAAVVMPDADPSQALVECVRCAFITSGQRCTCTRRIIVHRALADRFIPALCRAASGLILGDPAAEHPVFMGPIITEGARAAILEEVARLVRAGGELLVQPAAVDGGTGGWYLSPGVMRVERFTPGDDGPGADVEIFGPFVRVAVTDTLEDAIEQANATRFGLAASVFTRDPASIDRFRREARAGCVNVNCGTAGASSRLPFGGLGLSGNHRPAGAFSLDYCAYPVAGMTEGGVAAASAPGMPPLSL